MSGAGRLSPLRRGVWVLCVRVWTVRVSDGLVWLVSHVFHYWWKKDAVCVALTHVFLITADRDICFNFVRCKSISPNRLGRTILYKAFVRFGLLMIWYSITVSAKTIAPTAVSANPTKDFGKNPRSRRHEQSIPPIMKNERPNTQRNLLKRERYRTEHKQLHQIPNWGVAIAPDFS